MSREINININIPSDGDGSAPQPQTTQIPAQAQPQTQAQPAPQQVQESPKTRRKAITDLIERVAYCHNWRNFYELREHFIKHGLSIEPTAAGRTILCRIDEYGRPQHSKVVDDYIFLNNQNQLDEEISSRTAEVICNFIDRNATRGTAVNYGDMPDYHKQASMYGDAVRIAEEDTLAEAQDIEYMSRLLTEDEIQ